MRTLALMLALVLTTIGCDPPKPRPTKATERAGGLVSQIHDRVKETVTEFQMKDLHLLMLTEETQNNRVPSAAEVRDYASKENPKLAQLIENGTIVLTDTKDANGVWAHEKNAAESGGWIVRKNGPQKVTAEDFKKFMGK